MNLDLNLEPLVPPSPSREPISGSGLILGQPVNLDNWVDEEPLRIRLAEAVRLRARQRWRSQQVPILSESMNISMDLVGNLVETNETQTGEGSVVAEERTDEPVKVCENNSGDLGLETLGKREDVEKRCSNDGSFFDCNICLDLASDPVVTCCGHLFCWPCLFRWLHLHSDAKECPVCKGEVSVGNVTPIYGRGSNMREPEEDLGLKIPIRPQASRVESLRQSIPRNSFSFSMEEMFRRLGSRFDLAGESVPPLDTDSSRDVVERNHSLLNHILISRRRRREQNITASHNVMDSNQSSTTNLQNSLLRRTQAHRAIAMSLLHSPDPVVETYFRGQLVGTNQEQTPLVDDRDSFSSIGAVIHSGSQTVDTAFEIDSTVSLSTSSSRRRRNDVSRASDVNSGESRAPRRRRAN